MKKFIFGSLLASAFLLLTACSNSSDDDLGPMNPPVNNDVTYTNTVKSIIDSRCIVCHGNPLANDAPMPLITYANVRDAVQNRGLISQVESGNMPKTGANLATSQVQAIKDWQSGGFQQ